MNQNHEDVEHIVIDGGSTDNSVSILAKFPHLIWTSEKDSGQSDAINKGFRKATGEIVAWLNSDDYYEENIFKEIVDYFEAHPDCMFLYGAITHVNKYGKPLFSVSGDVISFQELIRCPDIVRQPSSFWRREVIREFGGLDERLHLVMDFDFFLRIARRYRFHYIDRNLSYFRTYDVNKTSAYPRRQIFEINQVFRKNKIHLRFFHLKYFSIKILDLFWVGRRLRAIVRLVRKRRITD